MRASLKRAVVGLALGIAMVPVLASVGATAASADQVGDEAAFVSRINTLRASKGLPAMAVDVRLVTIARNWSAHMAATNTLSHNGSYGAQAPSTWMKLGENVGYGPSVDSVATAFVNSPAHYANLVDPAFNAVGVGVVWSGATLWVTEDFMQGPVLTASSTPTGPGWYRLAGSGGEVYNFGSAAGLAGGGIGAVTGAASTPSGNGYWLASAGGAVATAGDAPALGSMAGRGLNSAIVGVSGTRSGQGYWLLGRDGGVFSFGDARFFGSTGAMHLNQPVVGMAPTPSGNGYWFVAADGGVFSFGDARFFGSTGSLHLNQPIVGMAATPSGNGYWLVARDGGIFAFGDAPFLGSTGSLHLNQPIVGMAATASGQGYRFVAADGGIFSFGDASFLGSTGGVPLPSPVVAMMGA